MTSEVHDDNPMEAEDVGMEVVEEEQKMEHVSPIVQVTEQPAVAEEPVQKQQQKR